MDTYTQPDPRRRRRVPKAVATGLGLLGLGAVAGGIASTAMSASAATTTTSAPAGSSTTAPSGSALPVPPGGGPVALPLTGTVTAVGSADVTIKTSTGTTSYPVTSTSDIDKNGEATLSDLAVGDAVTFSTVTSNGTTAIDKLHAGNAQLDMPAGPGPGGPPPGSAAGSSTTSGSSGV